jgi:hypothetical protein
MLSSVDNEVIELNATYVLAMDIGCKNCPWIVMNIERKEVIQWEKFAFNKPYSAVNISKQSVIFLDRLMREMHPIGATASNITVVIERQMTYNKRFSAINSMIKTLFHTLML